VTSIPPAWIDQTRAGGIILAPVFSGLAKLSITGPGNAQGRFIGPGYFMRHRTTPNTSPSGRPVALTDEPCWPSRITDLPSSVYYDNDFRFYLDLNMRDLAHGYLDGDLHNLTINAPDGSHAHITPEGQLTQSGPSRLWDDNRNHPPDLALAGQATPRTLRRDSYSTPPSDLAGHPDSAHTWPIDATASL
jgi:hypothetical protein